ncbi:hypothetical protein HDU91_007090 [Kappamyces sp. JEL0680]|nr:hypothetical protein HDU91_007090 [Kappamyces sp. JEL0680]
MSAITTTKYEKVVEDDTSSPAIQSHIKDLDKEELLPSSAQAVAQKESKSGHAQQVVLFWMAVNVVATISIVFTNKAVFSDKNLVKMPALFTAFHFFCTSMTLYLTSRAGIFVPKWVDIVKIFPLAAAFCGNVVLTNLSLAYSSVTFYQLARILLTPALAILNFVIYGVRVKREAIGAIALVCLGVGITTYYDTIGSSSTQKTTSGWGVFFALVGVTVSAIYTIWIGTFAKQYSCSSMQLLLNQAPVSCAILLVLSPFLDTYPDWSQVSSTTMFYIVLSGGFAILINMSQFFIVHGSSALTSTIVGHAKTCSIVALGWIFGGGMSTMSLFGVSVALSGIFAYSYYR